MAAHITDTSDDRNDEQDVRSLYREILTRWNSRNADALADLFGTDGNTSDSTEVRSTAVAKSRPLSRESSRIIRRRPTSARSERCGS